MSINELSAKVIGCSISAYYKWKKQNRPVVNFIHKYLNENDLNELLNTGEITKLNLVDEIGTLNNDLQVNFYANKQNAIFKSLIFPKMKETIQKHGFTITANNVKHILITTIIGLNDADLYYDTPEPTLSTKLSESYTRDFEIFTKLSIKERVDLRKALLIQSVSPLGNLELYILYKSKET